LHAMGFDCQVSWPKQPHFIRVVRSKMPLLPEIIGQFGMHLKKPGLQWEYRAQRHFSLSGGSPTVPNIFSQFILQYPKVVFQT
jgi:hypothetical protein